MRRALASHIATCTLAFVPGLLWLWDSLGAGVLGVAALIAIPHWIQDDGRLLHSYARTVKGVDLGESPALSAALDQSLHVLALFLTAILIGT
jgi:hypothetical protein